MHAIKHIFILGISFFLGTNCTPYEQNKSLQQAMQTVDGDPEAALILLSNIIHPQSLDQDSYMRYVVTLTQAKYMDYQDIIGDSLILDAQRYFMEKQNPELAARASYYAAAYWYTKEDDEKALEYALFAYDFSKQAQNHLFSAKSAQWIGGIYYDIYLLDSALVYYHQAHEFYNQISDVEEQKLGLIYMLGVTYLELSQCEQAMKYFNDGMEAARKLDNVLYEARFLHNMGVVFRIKEDYPKAREHFNVALFKRPDTEDSIRICLSYARLYRMDNQSDSTLFYLNLVKNKVELLTFPYNRKIAYEELALYYEKEGNYEKTKLYNQLVQNEEKIIHEMQSEGEILLINRLFQQFKNFECFKQNASQTYWQTIHIASICVITLFFLLIVFRFNSLTNKKKFREARSTQIAQKLDHQHFLLLGTRLITKGIDNLFHKSKNLNDSLIRKQFLVLRASFQVEMANQIHSAIRQLHNGAKAVMQLTTEDLCIIYLARLNYTDKDISRMLGYEDIPENHITLRRRQIRNILLGAGLANRDIEILLPA